MSDQDPYAKYKQPKVAPPSTTEDADPYAKYKQSKVAAAPAPAAAPATPRNYSRGEVLPAAAKNFPASTARLVKGVADTVLHPIDSAKSLGEIASGGYLKMLPAEHRASLVDARPELFQPMIEKANAVGGMYRGRYGSVEGLKRTIAEDPAGFLADVSTLLSVGSGAVKAVAGSTRAGTKAAQMGNAMATFTNPLSPGGPLSWPSRGIEGSATIARLAGQKQMGNAMSTVAHAVDPRTPVNAMGRVAKHVAMGPKATMVLGAAENPTAVARAQKSPQQIVPGSVPTPAEAAVNVGSTKFAALEDAARDRFSTEFGKLDDASNAARLAHADQVAHTPEVLADRLRQRKMDSARDYAISDKVMTYVTPKVWDLLHRDHIRGVLDDAKKRASLKGETFGTPPEALMQWSGRDIHWIKKALDDKAFGKGIDGQPSLPPDVVKDIRAVRDEFLDWVGQTGNNPAYIAGAKNYAEHSKAAARMQFGQHLKDLLQKPLTKEYTAELRADALAAALRDPITGNPHIKKATGGNYEMYARDLLTPGEMKVFERILEDMSRARRVQDQASKGGKHKQMMENALTDWSLPNAFRTPGLVNTLARIITGHGDEVIAKEVGTAMQTTKGAGKMLDEVRTRRVAVRNAGNKVRRTVGAATRYPAMYNALNEDEPRN